MSWIETPLPKSSWILSKIEALKSWKSKMPFFVKTTLPLILHSCAFSNCFLLFFTLNVPMIFWAMWEEELPQKPMFSKQKRICKIWNNRCRQKQLRSNKKKERGIYIHSIQANWLRGKTISSFFLSFFLSFSQF